MVKVNLKTTPSTDVPGGEETSSGRESTASERQPPERENIDLSFDSMESFFPKTDEEPSPPEGEESFVEERESPPVEPKAEIKIVDHDEDISPFKSSISKKKLYILFSISALVLLIVIFLIIRFLGKGEESVTQPIAEETPATSETEQPLAAPTEDALTPLLRQNLTTNRFINDQLRNFISQKPASADYSLIVITPTEINFTVLAESRDQVARFHMDLKKAFPNFNFRILSVQSKYENGKEMFYADFQAPISTVKASSSSAGGSALQPAPVQNFADAIKTLTAGNKIKLQYFKEGKVVDREFYREVLYYIHLNGKKQNILDFLKQLIQKYPNIRINKFAIFPYNLETISDRSLSTRISLTYYNRK